MSPSRDPASTATTQWVARTSSRVRPFVELAGRAAARASRQGHADERESEDDVELAHGERLRRRENRGASRGGTEGERNAVARHPPRQARRPQERYPRSTSHPQRTAHTADPCVARNESDAA